MVEEYSVYERLATQDPVLRDSITQQCLPKLAKVDRLPEKVIHTRFQARILVALENVGC